MGGRKFFAIADRRFCGVTLGELIVVLPFLALTAAMMFPFLGDARERARRTSCANNMAHIGIGMEMYLGLFGDYYPGRLNYGNHQSTRFGSGGRGIYRALPPGGGKARNGYSISIRHGAGRGATRDTG